MRSDRLQLHSNRSFARIEDHTMIGNVRLLWIIPAAVILLTPSLVWSCDPMDHDSDGWSHCDGDPNNEDPFVYPGASEVCDGQDNDGDGELDESCYGLCPNPAPLGADTRVTDAAGISWSPSLVWNGDGYAVTWRDERDGNKEIYLARLDRAGRRLGVDVRVTSDAAQSEAPWLVWTGSEYGVAWQDDRNGHWDIYFARYDREANPIGSAVRVTDDPGNSFGLSGLVWTGTEYGMAFRDNRHGNWEIYLALLDRSGVKVGPEVRVSNNTSYSASPSLVWTGSGFGVAWNDIPVADWEIYFVALDEDGAALAPERRITTVDAPSWYPSLTWNGDDDRFGLAWMDEQYGHSDIRFITLDSTGNPASTEERVTTSTSSSSLPRTVWTGAEYALAWHDNRDGNNEIYLARIGSSGQRIDSVRRVTSNSGDSRAPSLVWMGTDPAVAWYDARSGDWEIHFGRVECCHDLDTDGWDVCEGDLNDGDWVAFPGADEDCDGRDTDCDGQIDETCDGLCDSPRSVLPETRISNMTGFSDYPSLRWTGWNGHLLTWTDSAPGNQEIYLVGLYPDGSEIFSPVRVSNDAANSQHSVAVWTGDEIGVAWWDDRDGEGRIYFAAFDGAGNPTSPEIRLSDHYSSAPPALVWTGSEYGLAWTGERDGDHQVYFARLALGGSMIGRPRQVTVSEEAPAFPDLAWTGDGYGLVWAESGAEYFEIYFARLDRFGYLIGSPLQVSDLPVDSWHPSLVWTGSEFGLSWWDQEVSTNDHQVYFASFDASGDPVVAPRRISPYPGVASNPSIAWTGHEYAVAWNDFRHDQYEIYMARLDTAGNQVGPDVRVSFADNQSSFPELQWTGTGFGAAWKDLRDADHEIYFTEILCCDDVDSDGHSECDDCDDADSQTHPGADELCDGTDNDCDVWPALPVDEDDDDGDGYVECGPWTGDLPGVIGGGDCDDAATTVYPGSSEVNNGIDDQCPGYWGHGLTDEISGPFGFLDEFYPERLIWTPQAGASIYEVARSTVADFLGGGSCTTELTVFAFWDDPAPPPIGEAVYYIVRAWAPYSGSWGADSGGLERTTVCP